MPRIDPLQLLKCLSVLLSPEGGILSRDEVPRLVNLMTKFSKKLVSKCVYVLILKNTETSLVDMFMAEGGWTLIQTWLQDAAQSGNWDLVKEILGLLLVTPVDVERLKMNCLPKLIKNLSRREDLQGVAQLSSQIVQNWLVIVKGTGHGASPAHVPVQPEKREVEAEPVAIAAAAAAAPNRPEVERPADDDDEGSAEVRRDDVEGATDDGQAIKTSSFYKLSLKDGKQVIKKLAADEEGGAKETKSAEVDDDAKKVKASEKEKSSKSSSSSKSSRSSGSRDKDRSRDKRRSSSSSSKSKSSSSSRDKDRKEKDRDKHRNNGSSKSSPGKSSGKDKERKGGSRDKSKSRGEGKVPGERQAERDKDTLEKLKPMTIDRLGRIPKRAGPAEDKPKEAGKDKEAKEAKRKPSFSILDRKASGEERSKTVKVFNSKMRSTGLEEEAKPPPSRSAAAAKKSTTPSVQLPTIPPPKRPSPPPSREAAAAPPEKRPKVEAAPERPGAIKLIPPKPKPPVLQESDMFMDALAASAPKKEPKKRKRRPSVTKEVAPSPSSSPAGADPQAPASPTSNGPSVGLMKNIAPINFYQDTLSEEAASNGACKEENGTGAGDAPSSPTTTPADAAEANREEEEEEEEEEEGETPCRPKAANANGLRGVLLYAKKRGPKRSIRWKCDEDLVEIRFFELDETERVNVTKTFMDMAKMDISSEREALIMSRKLSNEDVMEPQTAWRTLHVCDQPEPLAPPGSRSLEKDIQFAREKTALPALYFDKRRIPDSAEEPVPENHHINDPVIIPLEDPECQEIDLRHTPWPEPKGSPPPPPPPQPPHVEPQPMPPMFQTLPPFSPANFNGMPPSQFAGMPPPFGGGPAGPPHVPLVPGSFCPPNMVPPNSMMVPPQQEMMNPGVFGSGADGYMGGHVGEPSYPPMAQFNGPQGPNMNVYAPNSFNHRGGRGGFRRGGGGGNNGGWVRMNGPGNWKRGGGGRGGRLCKNIQNHGYCRNGDNCPFVHPT